MRSVAEQGATALPWEAPAPPERAPAATPPRMAAEPAALLNLADVAYLGYPVLPLPFWYAVARVQGRLKYWLDRRARRAVRGNLASLVAAGAKTEPLEVATRRFFEQDRLRNILFLFAPRMDEAELERRVRFEGLEHLHRAMAEGKGVVLLMSHMNSAVGLIALLLLRAKGIDVRIAFPTPKDGFRPTSLRRWLDGRARREGLHERVGGFYAQFNIRPIVNHLRRNAAVAFTGDGMHAARFVEVEFFGKPVPFPTGAISVAQSTGSPVVPLFISGHAPMDLRVEIEEPFGVGKDVDAPDGVNARVASYAKKLEARIRANPIAWQHCTVPDTLNTMSSWSRRPLSDRYAL